MISGYKTMWCLVMFDLPVATKRGQKAATKFRHYLINEGYMMKQFSVYMKYYDSRNKAEAAAKRLKKQVPPQGKVTLLFITDRQFGQAQNFYGATVAESDEKPQQLALF